MTELQTVIGQIVDFVTEVNEKVDAVQTDVSALQVDFDAALEESAQDCDALDGTDEDAEEWDWINGQGNILKHALWVETSFTPHINCLIDQGKLVWMTNIISYATENGFSSQEVVVDCYVKVPESASALSCHGYGILNMPEREYQSNDTFLFKDGKDLKRYTRDNMSSTTIINAG